VVLGTE